MHIEFITCAKNLLKQKFHGLPLWYYHWNWHFLQKKN